MSRRDDDELDGMFDPEFAVAIPEALREDFEKWLDRHGLVLLPRGAERGTYYTTEADASARRMAELAKREEQGARSKPRRGKRR